MYSYKRQHLFTQFLSEWGEEFSQIYHILRYISSYSRLAGRFAFYGINDTPERINSSQKEWVALVPQFSHPAEREFFKPYWVPLEHDGYNLFIDLSSSGLTLFEVRYFPFEPYCWTKKIWFKEISRFLASATDETIDTYAEEKEYNKKWDEEIDALFAKRIDQGVGGKIPLGEISAQEIFIPDVKPEIKTEQNVITVSGVHPLFLKVLYPYYNNKIGLKELKAAEDLTMGLFNKITDISGLAFYVNNLGSLKITSYEFWFLPSKNGRVKWADNVFTVSHVDQELLRKVRETFSSIRQNSYQ